MNTETITSKGELISAIEAGLHPDYLYFWRHRVPQGQKGVGKECLSQWYPSPFEAQGFHYPTAEHYMMHHKALLFEDHEVAEQILVAPNPDKAKKLGRKVRRFNQHVWEGQRLQIVTEASVAKFSADPELFSYLLGTGERVLVEASPQDKIWGIGMDEKEAEGLHPRAWRGHNLLGFALMIARKQLCKG